ncbi:MAG: hypothetical protein LBC39_07470 [Methanobrevibacter sp.]|jgi:hypothetical protein|nr:hypothetical protein [Candidatus Methanovirga aequatorialis]
MMIKKTLSLILIPLIVTGPIPANNARISERTRDDYFYIEAEIAEQIGWVKLSTHRKKQR